MSRKYDFISMLDIDSAIEKAAAKLENEISALQATRPKMEAELSDLQEKVWTAKQLFEKAKINQADDFGQKHKSFQDLVEKQNSIKPQFFKKVEDKRIALEQTIHALKMEAVSLVQKTLLDVEAKYVCESATHRVSLTGRLLDAVRKDLDSNREYLDIRTNGHSILVVKTALIKAIGTITRAQSLTELKALLSDLSRELNNLNFDPVEKVVDLAEYENLSKKFSCEVGYLISPIGPPVMLKAGARESRNLFDSEGRLRHGRNPW